MAEKAINRQNVKSDTDSVRIPTMPPTYSDLIAPTIPS